ncbi:polyprenyl synthetase family protein [Microvirga mediterraneensis]|uniref:Probable farnesyl diphosphate synthase n=1 Tax=Microvirga mediterraneensis TaxID=2754695 RepID=A0A838BH55_9HYPH|nr:farnesyl diphosphate synthase [Microvirga mediterraneensis]MBA1154834.1 polyprenyl synthetase family protein [Microvirga mediterraneensis]
MTPSTSSFTTRLSDAAKVVEASLEALLSDKAAPGELARPPRLMAAMRHAVLGGGKRLRPFLTIEAARLCGVEGQGALRAGCAVELLHCYSLVHDDLPSMDDDDLRRGRPTVHRAYDEATAILVGDALQTLAFEVLADPATAGDAAIRSDLVLGLARASGPGGMVGGQLLDLTAEGRYGAVEMGKADVRLLQMMKTGAILTFSVEAGAILGQADAAARGKLVAYGRALGAAFQVADDILDREATPEALGKRTGKDQEKGKATLVDLLGMEGAQRECRQLVEKAESALDEFGPPAQTLREAVRFVVERQV